MSYIPRKIEKTFINYLNKSTPPYDVILLSGVRQSGKSTLLAHLFPPREHIHINLAFDAGFCDAIDATTGFNDLTFLIESRFNYQIGSGKILIFDEAQLSKKLGGYVRFFKEKWQKQQVILTGSTLSSLFDNHPNPTGRVVEFTLRPFNFLEFLKALQREPLLKKLEKWNVNNPFSETIHREVIQALQEYLVVGGLPDVVLAYQEKKDYLQILSNIFSFYKRDFQNKLDEKLTGIFTHCFLRIAGALGSPIKNTTIIKSSSPGYKKVSDVLSLLESWHQIIKVECEPSKLSKIGTITPKRYLFDHGIRYLQNPSRFGNLDLLDKQNLQRGEMGGILENFILTEFLSTNPSIVPRSWAKTHQSGLVDFIFMKEKKVYAVEVKSALSLNEKHLSTLLAYHQEYPSSQLVLTNLNRGGIHKIRPALSVLNIPVYAIDSFFRGTP